MPECTPNSLMILKLSGDGLRNIRGAHMDDGEDWFSVYDFMTKVCKYKDDGATARNAFARLIKNGSKHKNEIETTCAYCRFPGAAGPETPVMTIFGLQKLLLFMGGNVSKAFKEELFTLMQRYLDGDHTMLVEIKHNKSIGKKKSFEKFAEKVAEKAQIYIDASMKEMPPTSYIYGTKTPAFPGLIKIGNSSNLKARLSSLNTSCAPDPHVIVATTPTFDKDRDEDLAHAFFASARREGEFFAVSPEDVRSFFSSHIMPQYQLELAQNIASRQGTPI